MANLSINVTEKRITKRIRLNIKKRFYRFLDWAEERIEFHTGMNAFEGDGGFFFGAIGVMLGIGAVVLVSHVLTVGF